jgi:hypothetical protein
VVLDGYEAALRACPRADHRHRVEHAGVLSPAVLDRMARLGIIGVPQQHFIYRTGDGYLANLGPERAPWCYPQKAYLDRGMVLAGSSDRPVVPGAPLAGIHDAVNQMTSGGRPYVPEEAITPGAGHHRIHAGVGLLQLRGTDQGLPGGGQAGGPYCVGPRPDDHRPHGHWRDSGAGNLRGRAAALRGRRVRCLESTWSNEAKESQSCSFRASGRRRRFGADSALASLPRRHRFIIRP